MVDLNETQRQMCLALRAYEGKADTSSIKEWIRTERGREVSTSNLGKQAKTMIDAGLLERAGERDVGAPIPANVYALTDEGREVARDVDGGAQGATLSDADAQDLRLDVAELRTATQNAHERISEMEADAPERDAVRERFDALETRLDDVETRLENHEDAIGALDEKFKRLYQHVRGEAPPE